MVKVEMNNRHVWNEMNVIWYLIGKKL